MQFAKLLKFLHTLTHSKNIKESINCVIRSNKAKLKPKKKKNIAISVLCIKHYHYNHSQMRNAFQRQTGKITIIL